MSAFVVIWLTLMNLIKREPVAKTSAARACALESSWSLMYQTVPVENECENDHHNCDKNQHCNDTINGFECLCKKGYVKQGTQVSVYVIK